MTKKNSSEPWYEHERHRPAPALGPFRFYQAHIADFQKLAAHSCSKKTHSALSRLDWRRIEWPQEQHSADPLLPVLEYHTCQDGIPMQGEDGQHYVVLEVIQSEWEILSSFFGLSNQSCKLDRNRPYTWSKQSDHQGRQVRDHRGELPYRQGTQSGL